MLEKEIGMERASSTKFRERKSSVVSGEESPAYKPPKLFKLGELQKLVRGGGDSVADGQATLEEDELG